MSIDFKDLDLSSMVDEMESMISESKRNRPFNPILQDGLSSRVTASGFTESTAETVTELPTKLTQTQIAERVKMARDITSLTKLLDLNEEQILYCDDLIHRYSNKNAYPDDKATELQDMHMINTLSALSTLKMRGMANEVKSDMGEMRHHFRNITGESVKRRDSVLSYAETTMPNDSASQIPANRSGKLSHIRQKAHLVDRTSEVIGGYKLTTTIFEEEDDVELAPILGLPQVFVNDELNFLCHLHKPLKRILTEDGIYPCDDICGKLTRFVAKHKGRERDPEDNLLYMVIRHTFSLSRMQVRRNSFKLPLIEEGMYLDEKLMYMCVEQLYTKFSLLWFNSMKAIEVPDFHDKYKTRGATNAIRRTSATSKRTSRSMLNF